jgi:hypothetical protein
VGTEPGSPVRPGPSCPVSLCPVPNRHTGQCHHALRKPGGGAQWWWWGGRGGRGGGGDIGARMKGCDSSRSTGSPLSSRSTLLPQAALCGLSLLITHNATASRGSSLAAMRLATSYAESVQAKEAHSGLELRLV